MKTRRIGPSVDVIDVTPEQAKKWLANNTQNRALNRKRVAALATEMREGRWKLTHQGIAFGPTGVLLDGQHRLAAIVASGVAVKMLVTTGLDDVFSCIDTGVIRTAAQMQSRDGRKSATHVVKGVRDCLSWDHSGFEMSSDRWDNPAVLRACDIVGDRIERHVKRATRLHALGSVGFFAAFSLVTAIGIPDKSQPFFAALEDGAGLAADDPRLVLRNRLLDPVLSRTHGCREWVRKVLMIRAWNAFAEDRRLTKLIAPREYRNEGWPGVIGCSDVSFGLHQIAPR